MKSIYTSTTPALFCINDSEYSKDEHRKDVEPFIQELFPEKCAWEKDVLEAEDFQIYPVFEENEHLRTIVFAFNDGYSKYFAVANRKCPLLREV